MKPEVHPCDIELALDAATVSVPAAASGCDVELETAYCDGDMCRATWHQAPLTIASAKRRRWSSKRYCSRCFLNLKGKPEPLRVQPSLLRTSLFDLTSRQATLTKYIDVINDTQEYLWLLALIVLFWPLVWTYYCLWLRRMSRPPMSIAPSWHDQLHWILAAVSHLQCVCCCAYVWLLVLCIIYSCKYAAQAWFWVLLEAYTVYFLLLNIIYVASPIGKSSNDTHTVVADAPASTLATRVVLPSVSAAVASTKRVLFQVLQAIVLTFAPVCSIAYVERAVASLPNTFLLANVDTNFDINALVFVDADGRPLVDNPVPAVFAARLEGNTRLRKYRACLFVALQFVVAINAWLLLSWVTNVWPSQPFPIPVNPFMGMASNVDYTVTATMTDVCETQEFYAPYERYLVMWNLNLSPKPSAANGLPTLYLHFLSKRRPWEFILMDDVSGSVLNPWAPSFTDTVTLKPVADQRNYMFMAAVTDAGNCTDIQQLKPYATSIYNGGSLTQYLRSLPDRLALFPTLLLIKHCFRMYVVSAITGRASLQIWRLWIQFDQIAGRVDLTQHRNLEMWYRLRSRVFQVVRIYTQFIQALLAMALFQLASAVSGLFIFCLRGVAPLPGYFLLILTVFGSLSTLIFLLPLAKALDVQANHESLLQRIRLQLQLETKDLAAVASRHRCIECLARLATKIRTTDDRICIWGLQLSTARLIGLTVSIGSAVSFVFTRKLDHPWNEPRDGLYDSIPLLKTFGLVP
ncbi:hypothetical protein SDRG_12228 [Saprolegnia diclina VS20]|uniref:Transmembrane protein n=1 Tax=Saprolegnia diclina (strain VS20) TaxID=1156394 RepID=T0Q5T5_SAPDV|nr:hypothetical protein SDRG_12228 [Saprolegnia diclina VS20]EQC29946.1 hypothetical protein SDRG_12228 [Saprolegnia diclina VS20]|eukprot:XP_008616513.1 hypothetical protein SDRG_12228 [Saprolegnia diclina VS20]